MWFPSVKKKRYLHQENIGWKQREVLTAVSLYDGVMHTIFFQHGYSCIFYVFKIKMHTRCRKLKP